MLLLRKVLHRRLLPLINFQTSAMEHNIAADKRANIAVCQMTATNSREANLQTCKELIVSAKRHQAQMIFFPEACDYVGENKVETIDMAEPLDGLGLQSFQTLAKDNEVWLSLGGIHEKVDGNYIKNSHIIIDSCGNIVSSYSKLHLFDVDYPEGRVLLKESSYTKPGHSIVPPIETPIGKVGLSICYDLRFPEVSLCLRNLGAEILTFPSAFTFATGAAHWEILLRARAIESQCYVVAAAQTGHHNKKRTSWGHAMVVDPWGSIIAQCSEGTGLAIATIDLSLLNKTRLSMPLVEHRRHDLYPPMRPIAHAVPADSGPESYQFGQVSVSCGCIFLKTELTFAFTNKKCVVPGHILVAPIRCVPRLAELKPEEVADLFQIVHKIVPVVEEAYSGTSTSVVVQDGEDAGQTIKHVHVHVLPRRVGDFPQNDDIYYELAKHDKEDLKPIEWRTEDEMASEAASLRKLFK